MTSGDRALLLAEWSCAGSDVARCPVCQGAHAVHAHDCAMDLAFSERGFYSREERDRARAFISNGVAATAPTLPPPEPNDDGLKDR